MASGSLVVGTAGRQWNSRPLLDYHCTTPSTAPRAPTLMINAGYSSRTLVVIFQCVVALVACGDGGVTDPPPPPADAVAVERVIGGLSNPIHLAAPPGDARLFIVEQAGRIRIIRNAQVLATPFLDIRTLVQSGGERGLLSMAFHPAYATNGFFYVNYTDGNGDTQVARYTRSPDPDVADPSSAKTILSVAQPFGNHNGGLVQFGPDGMLYIGMGDGGSGGDPMNNGQMLSTLLGKLLRIDVDGGDPYGVPPSNPFVGQTGARGEIWAYGLRNPWRFSFDPPDSRLYVGDVGQNRREEVNAVPAASAGVNYGWKIMEGTLCFSPSTNCNQTGLTLPVLDYPTGSEGCSVIAGYVYRGSAIPSVVGHFFYSDWCGGWLRSFRLVGGAATDRREWNVGAIGRVVSFGRDGAGELYVMSDDGNVHRLVSGN